MNLDYSPPAGLRSADDSLPSSVVGKVKEIYRRASKGQRRQLRAWMRRVLSGEDGNDAEGVGK